MSTLRTLYTGYSGLANHQKCLDMVGNNIANVNTIGFKKNQFQFSTVFSQVLNAGDGGTANRGSRGSIDVGGGTMTGYISPVCTQGGLEQTGKPLDLAISGKGFFLTQSQGSYALTRDGSFYLDNTISPNQRLLCVGKGLPVLGWGASAGFIDTQTAPTQILIPAIGDTLPGQPSSIAELTGNLSSNPAASELTGLASTLLSLKGNLAPGNNTVSAYINVPVTQNIQSVPPGMTQSQAAEAIKNKEGAVQSSAYNNEVRQVQVDIVFSGPTTSVDGKLSSWTWEMYTRDWPAAGDPPVRVYPEEGKNPAVPSKASFYTQTSEIDNQAQGQSASGQLKPGSTSAYSIQQQPDGEFVVTQLSLSSGFALDVTRLTQLPSAPGGSAMEMWSVDGYQKGWLSRSATIFDAVTRFERPDLGNGQHGPLQAVRSVEPREVFMQFHNDGPASAGAGNSWSWISSDGGGTGNLTFNTQGNLASSSQNGRIRFDFSPLTQYNYQTSLTASAQDGYVQGHMKDLTIDQQGRIYGNYDNGVNTLLAQIAVATVMNPDGLWQTGGNLYIPSDSSGALIIGTAGGDTGAGTIQSGFLELSNVDLTSEFGSLITTERGYQLNARSITTADEMLKLLVQLKR